MRFMLMSVMRSEAMMLLFFIIDNLLVWYVDFDGKDSFLVARNRTCRLQI